MYPVLGAAGVAIQEFEPEEILVRLKKTVAVLLVTLIWPSIEQRAQLKTVEPEISKDRPAEFEFEMFGWVP